MDDECILFKRIFQVLSKDDFLDNPKAILSFMNDAGFNKPYIYLINSAINLERRRFILALTCPESEIECNVNTISDRCFIDNKRLLEVTIAIRKSLDTTPSEKENVDDFKHKWIMKDSESNPIDTSNTYYYGNEECHEATNYPKNHNNDIDASSVQYTIDTSGCLVVPESVSFIQECAFMNCSHLKEVLLPESLRTIGKSAFEGCTSLTVVHFPKHLKKIEECAFKKCISIRKIVISESTVIGDSAFEDCISLKNVDLSSDIGNNAFKNCKNIGTIRIYNPTYKFGATPMHIGEGAFAGCTKASLNIGQYSSDRCGNYLIVNKQSLLHYHDGGYKDATLIIGYGHVKSGNCIVPAAISRIGEGAFKDCTWIENVFISSNVKEIGKEAFAGCTSLKKVRVHKSISIAPDAFDNNVTIEYC